MNKIQMIQELSNAFGVSGFETDVVEVIKKYLPKSFEAQRDSLNNLIVRKKDFDEKKLRIQLDAHSDEVGFMIQNIHGNGTMSFVTLGGWVENNLPSQRVWIKNNNGDVIEGVIGSKPKHFVKDKNVSIDLQSLFIDVGASSKEEAIDSFGMAIGLPVVPATTCTYDDARKIFCGKAFDCRIGCAALLGVLEELEDIELGVEIVATFSSQEEVGLRGARLSAKKADADVAIVFEGTPADDIYQDIASQTKLHYGPMLRHFDNSMITNPRLQRFALDIAKEKGLKAQEAVRTGGGTNGGAIHLSNEGVPTIVLGVPVRYIHSPYGYCTLEDYEATIRLAVEIIKKLDLEKEKIYSL